MYVRTIRPTAVAMSAMTIGLALLAAACSSGQSAASGAAGAAQPSGAATVSMRSVNGATVLVSSGGKTLYTNNQDRPGRPMCTTSDCTAIWTPLMVQGAQPSAANTVSGKVASVRLPDGARQVTWNGMPLYTFSFDHGSGQVNGNGFHDSFDGTSFVWHAAMTQGQMTQGQQPAQSSNGSGFSY